MKVRLEFEKNVRYISHLEVMRTIQKILKRSALPLRYSEGFNPHIILSIAVPIPVGVCGKREYADFELLGDISDSIVMEQLKNASDDNIKPVRIQTGIVKDFKYACYAEYEIEMITKDADKIIEFLQKDTILCEKKAKGKIKIIDIKEYIHKMDFEKTDLGINIKCVLLCGIEKNLNPMLIRKAILKEGLNLEVYNATRMNILDKDMKEMS